MQSNSTIFGSLPDGREVRQYQLLTDSGASLSFLNLGGIVTELNIPDRVGKFDSVVLGFRSLAPYLRDEYKLGALIGRFGNRIKQGKFSIGDEVYELERNNLGNHLHGGNHGFHQAILEVEVEETKATLRHQSQDGAGGYPGNLDVTVTYELTEDLEWKISYKATTDKKTIINLTHHAYFNLGGTDVLSHRLRIHADSYLPVDENLIPEAISDVGGTPFDFRIEKEIGADIDQDHGQLRRGGGYDHCWIRALESAKNPVLIAEAWEETFGRKMEVLTTEPGVQFFSANFKHDLMGDEGEIFIPRSGFCLETQHFPDSPNRPEFPSTLLTPEKFLSLRPFTDSPHYELASRVSIFFQFAGWRIVEQMRTFAFLFQSPCLGEGD